MNDASPTPIIAAERANALPIYLDNQASTPVDPRVLEAMTPYFTIDYGNPHSESHVYGHRAMAAIDTARGQIAALIHADPREIVFTSGATEANNLAIKGAARFARAYPPAGGPPRDHVVALATEHKCVLESCAALERDDYAVTYLPVAESGLVALDALAVYMALAVRIAVIDREIRHHRFEHARIDRGRGLVVEIDRQRIGGDVVHAALRPCVRR